MTTPTFADLIEAETVDDVVTILLAIATSAGLNVTSWAAGSVARTILSIAGQEFADLSTIRALITASGFLDYAHDSWLTLLADQVYDVQRVPATNAAGSVTLSNSTLANIPLTTGSLHLANSFTGKTYTIAAGVTVPASGSASVAVTADEAGSASDAAPGEIDTIVNTVLGLTVTNPAPVLGTDEESDERLAQRCRESLGAASPDGPKEIYSFIAKTLTGLTSPVTRTRVFDDTATGNVSLYCATDFGASLPGDVALVDIAIHEGAEPLCVTSTAYAAIGVSQAVTSTVYVQSSSLTDPQIQQIVQDAVIAFAKVQPIGGIVVSGPNGIIDRGALEGAIFGSLAAIKSVTLTTPAVDVPLVPVELMVLGVITTTVVRL